jgi:hypothetical protein
MKTDVNKENDEIMRKGLSALYKQDKEIKERRAKMEKEGVKEQVMDFIFGKSDYNPLRDGEVQNDK